MEPRRRPAVLRRGSGHVRAHPPEAVRRAAAAVARSRAHGSDAAALHDPERVHQHAQAAAHHADGAAPRRGLSVQRHTRGQRSGDTPHDGVLHSGFWASGRGGDESASAHRGRAAHLHAGRQRRGEHRFHTRSEKFLLVSLLRRAFMSAGHSHRGDSGQ